MKANLFLPVIIASALLFASSAFSEEGVINPCEGITIDSMSEHVPVPPAIILSKQSVNGICEVILDIDGQYVPVYAGKNYVIAGEMFQEKRQVTQSRIDKLKADDFIQLKPDIEKCVAMTYAPEGKIKHTVYMITDPVCTFCHQAESELIEFAQKHSVEFKLIFDSVHPPVGRQKAIEAVCRKLGLAAYIESAWKDDNQTGQYQCAEGIDLIEASEKVAAELGIDGVPVFYLETGRRIDGADMQALESAISDLDLTVSDAK